MGDARVCGSAEDAPSEPITTDRLLGGRVILRQPARGHRSGTDAVLLAMLSPRVESGLVVDVGAGAGAVGIAIATWAPDVRIVLVEDEPFMAALARENLVLNGLAERGSVAEADIYDAAMRRDAALFDEMAAAVVTNPPFFRAGNVRRSGTPLRARAHVLAGDSRTAVPPLVAWIRASLALLAPGGRFAMIQRPDALPQILDAFQQRVGAIRLTPVQAFEGSDAGRILVDAVKGNRAPLAIRRPFVLHGLDGRFTPEAEALHRGEPYG